MGCWQDEEGGEEGVTDVVGAGIDEAGGGGVAFVVFSGGVLGGLVRGAELDVGFVEVVRYPWSCWVNLGVLQETRVGPEVRDEENM